ncbi:autotransporter outer membrane beta-barrel domain-containing protein [Campylobacter hyointestinalis]|uniref:autotransporter family protein n=1 Tax=Campylobacter hyointestinalis TaxID=198 RepID=UPI0007C8C477|nr:autotransporter outer membrane beta-barrel domain-containing protein [Campylobacter hyointestinalis]
MLEAQTAYKNAYDAVEKANKHKTDLEKQIADFRSSAKQVQDLAVKFTNAAKDLTSSGSATITGLNDGTGVLIQDGGKDIKIKEANKDNAKTLATTVASKIKESFAAIATPGAENKLDIKNVAENAVKIYAMLNTELKKDDNTLLSDKVTGNAPTVANLLNTIYKDATGAEGEKKAATNENIAALKALQPEIMEALNDFAAKADALNKTFAAEKQDAFTAPTNIITGTATLSKDQAFTAQAQAVKDALKKLAGDNGAKLDAVIGTDLKTAKGTPIDNTTIGNIKTSGVAGIDVNGVDATKLKNLLADDGITDADIKAYNEFMTALNSLKEQLNKTTAASLVNDIVTKGTPTSNVFKSLQEAGLTNLVDPTLSLDATSGLPTADTYLKDFAEQIEKPMQQATNEAAVATSSPIGALTVLNHASSINTATRLAKLSGFDANNMALASAIKNMDGIELASGDTSALSSIVKEYTDRFNYDNSVWANFIGAKGNTNNGNPELYGFSVGYDRSLDNAIVGGYFTYASSKVDTANLENEADNFEFGLYSRIFYGQNEFDLGASYGFGNNDITYSNYNKVVSALLSGSTDYDSKFINLNASYGYVLKAGDTIFVKPFIGLGYTYSSNDDYTLNKVNFKSVDTNVVYADLGVELRKYLNDGSYVFITPAIEQELSRNSDDTIASFVGANSAFLTNPADEKEQTYAKLTVGGEYAISKSLSTTLTLGYKGNTDNTLVNGSLGVKYKF